MVIAPVSIREDYWETFTLSEADLDYLYNHLLEIETPLTPQELTAALVAERIRQERQALENQKSPDGAVYLPKDHYEIGQALILPALNWGKGKVIQVRAGNNPDVGVFEVIEVALETGETMEFAAGLEDHPLNQPITISPDDQLLNVEPVLQQYGSYLAEKLESALEANSDLVRIAGRWFPRALLVDVGVGYLNLAEAVLDMENGGPLTTRALLEQIELPTDVNPKLTEFSLNLTLQEDPRFDEVGQAGKTLWFLQRLEPENVQQPPIFLRYTPTDYDRSVLTPDMLSLEVELDDELSDVNYPSSTAEDEVVISLLYPHWRSGTLPLTRRIKKLFPTAYETPRVQFTLVDGVSGEKYSGWVVRSNRYVYGLKEWYDAQGIIPGSLVHIQKSKNPGEVIITADKHRPNREWMRTVLIGTDGGVVFATLKQNISTPYDERMAICIPDISAVDRNWELMSKQRLSLEQVITSTMRELGKLNPQGHVHAEELYAAVNIVRRCPPAPIFSLLATRQKFVHLGDLHFRLDEDNQQGS